MARSKYRSTVMVHLSDGPATSSTIADDADVSIASISYELGNLHDADIVELLVDENTRKGRYYGLTEHGERIAELVEEVEGQRARPKRSIGTSSATSPGRSTEHESSRNLATARARRPTCKRRPASTSRTSREPSADSRNADSSATNPRADRDRNATTNSLTVAKQSPTGARR